MAYKFFVISLPDNYGKLKKEKNFYIGLSEPAFGIIYDLKPPQNFFYLTPEKKKNKLILKRIKFFDPALNTERIGYITSLIPEIEGDYYLCIKSDYLLSKDSKVIKILAKSIFHVKKEKNWDNLCGFNLEIKPYSRPYGIRKNGILWGQVLYNKPLENEIIEVERFSPSFLTLENLPKDSYKEINYPLLKKTVKTDKNGFLWFL